MLTEPKTDKAHIKTTGIEEVNVPTTGIEEYKAPVTGILEAKVPTTGIEEFKEPVELPHKDPEIVSSAPSKPVAGTPKGMVNFGSDKEFRAGQKLWHPVWHEAGTVIGEENFRGTLLLVENGKPTEAYNTTQYAKTPIFLTVDFEKMGKRRLVCNLERPQ